MARKNRILIIFLVTLLSLNLSVMGVSSYQDSDHKSKGCYLGFGFFLPDTSILFSGTLIRKNRHRLNISKEQSAEIRRMIMEIKEFYIKSYAKLKIAELELVNLLKKSNPSRREVKKKVKALGDLRTLLAVRQMEHLITINDLLTSEQKEILKRTR